MDWKEAGGGWGARATEWAYLVEPYALPANELLFYRLAVNPGIPLLDIVCGSGFAASVAARKGALVSGIDASEQLIAIAAARTPSGTFRQAICSLYRSRMTASMSSPVSTGSGRHAMAPWKRRIVYLSQRAVSASPFGGNSIGWADAYFLKVIELSPTTHGTASMEQGDTENVIEDMLTATGFACLISGDRECGEQVARRVDCRSSPSGRWAVCSRDRGCWLRRVLRGRRSHCPPLQRQSGGANHFRVRLGNSSFH